MVARRGLTNFSIAALVDELDGSTGAIYAHFGTKTAIHHALVRRALHRRNERVTRRPGHTNNDEEIVNALIDLEDGSTSLAVVLSTWAEATVEPMIRSAVTTADQHLRELLTTGPHRHSEEAADLALSAARAELLARALRAQASEPALVRTAALNKNRSVPGP